MDLFFFAVGESDRFSDSVVSPVQCVDYRVQFRHIRDSPLPLLFDYEAVINIGLSHFAYEDLPVLYGESLDDSAFLQT